MFEGIAAGVVEGWFLGAHAIPTLPDRIPTHFGLSGAADASGPASSLWFLPVVITGMYVFLSAVRFLPARLMNYPVTITDRNREAVYAIGREMLPAVKICALLTILAVEWGASMQQAAERSASFLAGVFAPVILLFALMMYYTFKMRAV